MESTNIIWFTCILAFFAGGVICTAVSALFSKSRQTVKSLEKKLKETEKEFTDYRNKVNDHFSTTAQMTHELTTNYRRMYQHLAEGASVLCNDNLAHEQLANNSVGTALLSSDFNAIETTDTEKKLLTPSEEQKSEERKTETLLERIKTPPENSEQEKNTLNNNDHDISNKEMSEEVSPLEPPKDYAPKTHPDDKGMLSEDFSIKNGSLSHDSIETEISPAPVSAEPIKQPKSMTNDQAESQSKESKTTTTSSESIHQ